MDLGKVLYDVLSTDSDVISLVGDNEAADGKRIFPVRASYKETVPLLIYRIGNTNPTNVKGENSGLDTVGFDIYVYGNSYGECTELSEYVRIALDGYAGTNNGVEVGKIWFDNHEETWDTEAETPVIVHSYIARILQSGSAPAVGITPSGRMYDKPVRNFNNTASATTGDYGYHRDLGVYENPIPDNPQFIMQVDNAQATEILKAKTLKVYNALGNKIRFTALDGTETFGDEFFIDHLTGLGWWMENYGTGTKATAITHANASTDKTYSDWRVPTTEEWVTLFITQDGVVSDLAQIPVVPDVGTYWTLTHAAGFEASYSEVVITGSGRVWYYPIINSNKYGVLVRNQYTSG